MDDYQYSSLDPRTSSFRLLKLRPGDTTTIECEILDSSIGNSNTLSYEALSYAWGSTELVRRVKINKQTLWITENLYTALTCLRSRDHDRILWIDAICINQANKDEQSQQVGEMGRIFGFASRVIFWLGMPTQEVVLLMEALNAFQVKCTAVARAGAQVDSTTWKTLWSNFQSRLSPSNDNLLAQQRKGLRVLLRRPWFERVWILQEVYNARSAIVCCDSWSVSADIFALGPSLLEQSPSQHVQSVLEMMPGPIRLDAQPRPTQRDLVSLLADFHTCKAIDQRDMIFALLGMSLESSDHELLLPDYNKPLPEVVCNTIRYWFGWTTTSVCQIMDILSNFKTVRATYLILPPEPRGITETLQVPSSSATIQCVRDVSLLLLEQEKDETTKRQDLCHIELDQLQSRLNPNSLLYNTEDGNALRIVPWSTEWQSVTLLIVREVKRALSLLASHECKQTFNFVGNRSLDTRPGICNDLLLEVAEEGNCNIVDLLLNSGVDSNAQGGKYGSALYLASYGDHEKIAQMLLDRGADVDAQRGKYGSALQAASRWGHEKVVQMLLEKGANVNAQGGEYGSALQAASVYGYERVTEILLQYGAKRG